VLKGGRVQAVPLSATIVKAYAERAGLEVIRHKSVDTLRGYVTDLFHELRAQRSSDVRRGPCCGGARRAAHHAH
jgi:hypothetical protein